MILTNKTLDNMLESLRICADKTQKTVILKRFTFEPMPYGWSEQDISVQIQNFISCGEFVKPIRDNGHQYDLLPGMEF